MFRHMQSKHKPEKAQKPPKEPYLHKCHHCNKEFTYASNLNKHQKTCKPAKRTKPLNSTPVTPEDMGNLFASMSSCTQR